MKITIINPKSLFKSKNKHQSVVSRSEQSSFSSSESLESSDHNQGSLIKSNGVSTPTSVLPTHSHEASSSGEFWPEISADLQFELVQSFKMIDSDGDGRISREELEALLTRVGAAPPTPEELRLMLSEVDRDGDGRISLEGFGAISSVFAPPACDGELKEAFDFFDTDHDGKITADELLDVFRSIGDGRCTLEDCRRMIGSVDKNGDGFVCFEDFTRMMEQQR